MQGELLARRVVQQFRYLEMRDRRADCCRDAVADQAENDVGIEDRERHLAVRACLGDLRSRAAAIHLGTLQPAAACATDEPLAFLHAGETLDDDDAGLLELDTGRRCGPPACQIDLGPQSRGVGPGISSEQLELPACRLPAELRCAAEVIERRVDSALLPYA